jgi:hypothetical protein
MIVFLLQDNRNEKENPWVLYLSLLWELDTPHVILESWSAIIFNYWDTDEARGNDYLIVSFTPQLEIMMDVDYYLMKSTRLLHKKSTSIIFPPWLPSPLRLQDRTCQEVWSHLIKDLIIIYKIMKAGEGVDYTEMLFWYPRDIERPSKIQEGRHTSESLEEIVYYVESLTPKHSLQPSCKRSRLFLNILIFSRHPDWSL